jgi:hypothetical protein
MSKTQLITSALTLAACALALALTSCAAIESVSIATPYGDMSKDALGNVSISPRAIVIPAK